ncbi:uncharacterized protein LOC117315534 [Pecten maximus]|uniref:uncharacterized protein LOC117315534 n=1 Tax=Pecten maximus TaxID=6579 RepID=UPI001458DAD6|nr:uncharacterized protein LOC117315534 [Pecten maximus]
MAVQDKGDGKGDCLRQQETSFFKTALQYEDYKSGQLKRSSDVKTLTGRESESSWDPKTSTTTKSDLTRDTKQLTVPKADSEQNTQAMLNRIAAHIRVQSPILASAVKPEGKSLETHASPQPNRMLSLMRRDKSTSSQEGDSNPGNMFHLIKLRNIARNVKNIQHDRQKRLENTGNVTLVRQIQKIQL